MNSYLVQFQDLTGDWKTVSTGNDELSAQRVKIEMNNVRLSNPGYRVRIVDENERLIDMLT